jgi:antitoxin component of RelBE/YafQ-DinJ toxin-antitoxin module
MVQAITMAKDKTFNIRLDEQDRMRLDEIAAHYAAPAATAVRILIKREHDRLALETGETGEPFELEQRHHDVLRAIKTLTARKKGGVQMADMREEVGSAKSARWPAALLPTTINELRRAGRIVRLSSGYRLKG